MRGPDTNYEAPSCGRESALLRSSTRSNPKTIKSTVFRHQRSGSLSQTSAVSSAFAIRFGNWSRGRLIWASANPRRSQVDLVVVARQGRALPKDQQVPREEAREHPDLDDRLASPKPCVEQDRQEVLEHLPDGWRALAAVGDAEGKGKRTSVELLL